MFSFFRISRFRSLRPPTNSPTPQVCLRWRGRPQSLLRVPSMAWPSVDRRNTAQIPINHKRLTTLVVWSPGAQEPPTKSLIKPDQTRTKSRSNLIKPDQTRKFPINPPLLPEEQNPIKPDQTRTKSRSNPIKPDQTRTNPEQILISPKTPHDPGFLESGCSEIPRFSGVGLLVRQNWRVAVSSSCGSLVV